MKMGYMMRQTKILTTADAKEWTALLERTERPDIYFTPEYARIYERKYTPEIDESFCGETVVFVYGDDEECVLYPFIKRRIDLPHLQGTAHEPRQYDIISHYGYEGPILNCPNPSRRDALVREFRTAFSTYCKEQRIVTEFIRFHPLLRNHEPLEGLLPVEKRNHTVVVDLTRSEAELLDRMNKKTRNLIRKAEKSGVIIERSEQMDDLRRFVELYLDRMTKNRAHQKYLFSYDFYEQTVASLGKHASLFVAKLDGKVIAASLFMHRYGFLHYHFSGSDKAYLTLAPNNLLLWTVMKWGKAQGYRQFHLGGGRGKDDELFHFKAGFSPDHAQFCTASVIHDRAAYDSLCRQRDEANKTRSAERKDDYFPYYRKPLEG
jgi:hypothetical protein